MGDLHHIREPIAGFLHAFSIEQRNTNPVVRRYRFACENGCKGSWRRDQAVAIEDGQKHWGEQE